MSRYIVAKSPVRSTVTQRIIGYRVRLSDGTSYYEQVKRVPRGHAVNFGPQWADWR